MAATESRHKQNHAHHEVEEISKASDYPAPVVRIDSYLDDEHINLSWRSWMVVFVTCFAIMAQVFVVVAAGSVIAFIIRDLGEPSLAGWIIQVCHLGTGIGGSEV